MTVGTKDRYPGIKAFEVEESEIFFGRQFESNELYAQVKANNLVVLFAKSGIGKSSLINAGLIPKFEGEPYKLIKVRLQNMAISPVENLKKELRTHFKEQTIPSYARQSINQLGLWEYLKACKFGEDTTTESESMVPVIIFDQFEEFFNHKKESRDSLINELSDLVNVRLPERIRISLRSIPLSERKERDLKWHSPIDIKILFAIRSDQLNRLDDLKESIPSILDSRFQLKSLNKNQARNAIVEPAKIDNNKYATAPFQYEPKALETLLDFLSNEEDEIESFSLQLVCQHIERKLKEKQ